MRTESRFGGGTSALNDRHPLIARISVFLGCLTEMADPAVKRRIRWTPLATSTAAVLMALDHGCPLQSRFQDAHACMGKDFRRRRRTGKTYNGLVNALERQQTTVLPVLKADLRIRVRHRRNRIDATHGWLLLAVDGSKEELPRTRDHEEVFGIADNGAYPQGFVTVVVEVHTGMLWDWGIGHARASEKKHLMEMGGDLARDALLLADGAFVGFPIWSQLDSQGKHFLIRVRGDVRLITPLWSNVQTRRERDIVYVWPNSAQKSSSPPKLRLIKVGSGPRAVYLLTNDLDSRRLSKKVAGTIYRKRWGVALFYRTFKRTLGYAKLRSKVERRAEIELEWALVAMTIATMLGIDSIARRGHNSRRLSPAQLIRTLRNSLLREGRVHQRAHAGLDRALGASLKDRYKRRSSKQSRRRVITTSTPKPLLQPPIARPATREERQKAMEYLNVNAA